MAFLFLKIEQMVFFIFEKYGHEKTFRKIPKVLCLILFLSDYKEAECNNKSVNLLE